MTRQRARSANDKALRREDILSEARRALEETRVHELTVARLARGAGLGSATLYTYFAGREDFLLSVFERELRGLIAEVCEGVRRAKDPPAAARVLVDAIVARRVYRKLAVVLHTQLEPRVSEERRRLFQKLLLSELSRAGAALEDSLPALPPGGGAVALRRLHALALGLNELVDRDGRMLGGGMDFAGELHESLTAVLTGMARSSGDDHGRTL